MNQFNTKLMIEMVKQILQQHYDDHSIQPLCPNNSISHAQQHQNLLSNVQSSVPNIPPTNLVSSTFSESFQTTILASIPEPSSFQPNTCCLSSITSNQLKQANKQLTTKNGNPNFSNILPLLFRCIESNRIFTPNVHSSTNSEPEAVISQVVNLIDRIIYLNSVQQSNSNNVIAIQDVKDEQDHDSKKNLLVDCKEENKDEFCILDSIPDKEVIHSDSSHSSSLSNKDKTNKSKRKRKEENGQNSTTHEHDIHQPRNKVQKKIQIEAHSDNHSVKGNAKELLLNQFCNYTVDTLKEKLTNTGKRGRGRPRKPDETSQSLNSSSSFYTKSSFHHVHFNKQ